MSPQLRVRGWEKGPSNAVSAHPVAHDAMEVTLIEAGTLKYRVGRRELLASSGQVVVVPHQAEHATTFLTSMRGVALWIGADLVAQVSDAMNMRGTMVSPGILHDKRREKRRRDRIASLMSVLVEEVTESEAGHVHAAEAIAESIVIEMLRRAPTDPGMRCKDPRVAAALAQIHASYSEALTVDDLSKTARMSRFHFSRLFRDEVGQAPYQYLLQLRIARAAELLRSGKHSVTEAALASGFLDFSRFSRLFRKHTGVRPVEMLRAARSA